MTEHIARLQLIAGIVRPMLTTYFVTSKVWGEIAAEIASHPGLLKPGTPAPDRSNFHKLRIDTLTVVNSSTDDQDVCDALNRPEAERASFRAKAERYGRRRSWLEQTLRPGQGGRPMGGVVTQAEQGPVMVEGD